MGKYVAMRNDGSKVTVSFDNQKEADKWKSGFNRNTSVKKDKIASVTKKPSTTKRKSDDDLFGFGRGFF